VLPDHPQTAVPSSRRGPLSPQAERLVAAARRLLARGGYEALTVEAVAAEAGAYRDSVRYYFGSKAAFIAAVVESLAHEQSMTVAEETKKLPPGHTRVHTLVSSDRQLLDDREGFRDFFALFPHIVVDDELRGMVAELYDWYRDLYADAMAAGGGDRAELREIASLMVAMIDGLAVQKLLDPEHTDLEALLALWERLLRRGGPDATR
jgi:AcrR family transcriptional regulator